MLLWFHSQPFCDSLLVYEAIFLHLLDCPLAYTKSDECAAICTSEISSWSRDSRILVRKSGLSLVLLTRLSTVSKDFLACLTFDRLFDQTHGLRFVRTGIFDQCINGS